MKLLFVVNPISGGINKEPFLKQAIELCFKYGIDYNIFKTTGFGDEKALKSLLDLLKPDKVVSVGGDGTVLFTSIVLMNTGYAMGIVPLGSANGMAEELKVNSDPVEAFKDIIMSNLIRGLDLVCVNDKYYSVHIGDVGLNARIVEAYEKDPNRGMITYAKYFLNEIGKLEPFAVKVHAEEYNYEGKVFMVGICNARKFGTGIPINRVGNPMDGKLEVVLIEKIDVLSLIKAGLAKFDESFLDNRTATVFSVKNAIITFDKPRLLQLDGEVIGKFEQINVKTVPSAVNFITTNENEFA
jgi:diacylglycerol kinase family enzyme